MRRNVVSLLALILAPSLAQGQDTRARSQPGEARLVTSDVVRFWEIFDRASDQELPDLLRTEYLESGTQALRDFIPFRIISADSLAALVIRQRPRYEAARAASLRVAELEREIRAAWYALKYLYPYATFPDTYFVIGRFNSGGTASDRGAIIGAEMLPDPVQVPWLVAHELVHFQQPPVPGPRQTLLARVIREGAADFIAELVTGRPPSAPYMAYGYTNEVALWRELSQVLDAANTQGWLYGGQPSGRPADLGYFFGYRIAEAFYNAAQDKRKAVGDIINVTDYHDFLSRSAYDPDNP
jgi:hypothetical protein